MSSPLEQAIATLVTRLETITSRLENVEKQLASGASLGAPAAASSSSSGAGDASSSAAVRDYEDLIAAHITPLAAVTQKIGSDELKAQVALIEKLVESQKNFIATAAASKKPDAAAIEKLLAPSVALIGEITALRDKNRTSKQFNHLSAISEGVPAFGWVVVSPTPGPYVNEARASSEFYSNKILVEFKKKDETQVEWVSNWNNFLKELATYIKKHHTTELTWNPRGGDASAASSAPSAPKPPSAPAPPPAGGLPPASSAPKPDANALFAALNKGNAITSGLKKVEKSQMTHKNPELRAASVVPAAAVAPKKPAASSAKAGAKKGTPKFELQGNKWVVEFQDGNKSIEINQTEPKQAVYIYKSDNAVVRINGKVNSIAIDSCNKTGIVFQDAISSVEAVNSNSIEIQVLKNVPSVTIDKCSGVQIYLSKDSLHTEVVTSKSDQMNVLIPGAKEGDDLIELPVPEQYKTTVKGNRLNTETMEHV